MTAAIPAPGAFNQPAAGGQPVRSLPDAQYGQQQAYRQQQQSAPLANSDANAIASPPPPSAVAGTPAPNQPAQPEQLGPAGLPTAPPPAQPLPPLTAPTQRPNEPITSGVPRGAGPNTLPDQQSTVSLQDAISPYIAADTTGVLAALANNLSQRGIW